MRQKYKNNQFAKWKFPKLINRLKLEIFIPYHPTSIGPPTDTAVETKSNPNPLIGTVPFPEIVSILEQKHVPAILSSLVLCHGQLSV